MRSLSKSVSLLLALALPGYSAMLSKPNPALRLATSAGVTPITATLLTSGSTSTDGTSAATASVTPGANKLILLFVATSDGTDPTEAPSSVTGNGLTWVQVNHIENEGGFRGLTVLRAMGSSPSAGAITINYAATKTGFIWDVIEIANVDTSGTNGSGAVVQNDTQQTIGDTTSITSTLGAFASVNNATIGGVQMNSTSSAVTPGSGFTELSDDGVATPSTQLQTEFKDTNDTTVDFSWTGNLSASAISIELKAGS